MFHYAYNVTTSHVTISHICPIKLFSTYPKQKREALIEIALDEFSNLDYSSASISRIVREAGIAKGSFYQYFQDKKDLYLYLLSLVSEAKLALLQQTKPPKAEMNFYEYLCWLFDMSIHFDKTHPILSRLAYRAFYGNSSFQDREIDKEKYFSRFIHHIVIRGVERGDIDPDLDLELVVFVVNTLVNAFNSYIPQRLGTTGDILAKKGSSSFDAESAKEIFAQLVQILQSGLAVKQNIDRK